MVKEVAPDSLSKQINWGGQNSKDKDEKKKKAKKKDDSILARIKKLAGLE